MNIFRTEQSARINGTIPRDLIQRVRQDKRRKRDISRDKFESSSLTMRNEIETFDIKGSITFVMMELHVEYEKRKQKEHDPFKPCKADIIGTIRKFIIEKGKLPLHCKRRARFESEKLEIPTSDFLEACTLDL
ncbi:hypothetical protein Tco_1002619 [Tanacetum coccineum]|uniref:Uncharacterized protein n=1 Tax=Tanacetum coccineum TaxID=301880 RepID=A0ABQ5F6R6_9ASTR